MLSQAKHHRLRGGKSIRDFRDIEPTGVGSRLTDRVCGQMARVDEESDVPHVLRVRAAHHLGEKKIKGGGTEEPQMMEDWLGNGNEMPNPSRTQDHLVFLKQMGKVKAGGIKLAIGEFQGVPKGKILIQQG